MPSRPVLIGRGLVPQTLNQTYKTPRVHNQSTINTIDNKTTAWTTTTPVNTTRGTVVDRKSYGGHSERETPGPIPNPEVKPFSADGTATERLWESRTPPDMISSRATP